MYIPTFFVMYLTWHFLAKRIIFHLFSFVDAVHMPNEYSVSNLHRFIHRGMVDCTSLIWINRILCYFILRGMADSITQHSYGSTHKFIVFVSTWTTVPNYSVLQLYFSPRFFTHGPLYCFLCYSGAHSSSSNNNIGVVLLF